MGEQQSEELHPVYLLHQNIVELHTTIHKVHFPCGYNIRLLRCI